jgi:hypothetical protein
MGYLDNLPVLHLRCLGCNKLFDWQMSHLVAKGIRTPRMTCKTKCMAKQVSKSMLEKNKRKRENDNR